MTHVRHGCVLTRRRTVVTASGWREATGLPGERGDGMRGTAEIENYLPLVEQIVVQVAVNFPRHVDRGELVRAGVLGLVEAGARFDAERGVAVGKLAARRIRGGLLDAVRAADWWPG